MADDAERDRRDDIRNELNDRKDALRDQHDIDMEGLDRRLEIIDAEFEAESELLEKRLKNASLYAEARKILERGITDELIRQLKEYEDEFGEGMGILGDYVKTKLTQQILNAGEALQNLAHNVRVATDENIFERIIAGHDIPARDILYEMFNTTDIDTIIVRINQAISNIDTESVRDEIRQLGIEFNRLINGNFDLSIRPFVSGEQLRDAGWNHEGGSTATFADEFQVNDAAGNQITIRVTPILRNGKILTPDELHAYINEQINGAENLLQADNSEGLIIATSVGWDEDAFAELDNALEGIKQRHTDLWLSLQDNIERFTQMTDEGLFDFIDRQFGSIPEAARNAIAEALRELGTGQVSLEEALQNIFNLPVENVSAILNTNLANLSSEQIKTIEQMRQNSVAWEQATTEAERARIAAENERLALAQGYFRDKDGVWYLDADKTQKVFDLLLEIQAVQIEHFNVLIDKYEEDFKRFDEFQRKKMQSVRRLNDEILRSNNDLLHLLSQNTQRFVNNVGGVIGQIAQIINDLIVRLNGVSELAARTEIVVNQILSDDSTTSIPRFASGGLNRGAGLRFLDPDEQVLSSEQTKAFSELVFGLGSEGMRNITESINQGGSPVVGQNRGVMEANFNFHGSITQEAMPQVRKLLGDAIYELKGEIPSLVAREQREGLRRLGGR